MRSTRACPVSRNLLASMTPTLSRRLEIDRSGPVRHESAPYARREGVVALIERELQGFPGGRGRFRNVAVRRVRRRERVEDQCVPSTRRLRGGFAERHGLLRIAQL